MKYNQCSYKKREETDTEGEPHEMTEALIGVI